MADPKDLYLSNLTETLRQSQRYMAIGLGASLFFALVVFAAPVDVKQVRAPIGPLEVLVSQNTALALSITVYWVAGLLATFFISRIASIIVLLRDRDLVIAALTYPSVLTTKPPAGRFGACFIPPILVAIGMVGIFGRELLGAWRIFGLFWLVLPYLQLGWDLRRPLGMDVAKERALDLVRRYCENSDESRKPSSYSVVKEIGDTGFLVRTVTDDVESFYVVANVGERVEKYSRKESR